MKKQPQPQPLKNAMPFSFTWFFTLFALSTLTSVILGYSDTTPAAVSAALTPTVTELVPPTVVPAFVDGHQIPLQVGTTYSHNGIYTSLFFSCQNSQLSILHLLAQATPLTLSTLFSPLSLMDIGTLQLPTATNTGTLLVTETPSFAYTCACTCVQALSNSSISNTAVGLYAVMGISLTQLSFLVASTINMDAGNAIIRPVIICGLLVSLASSFFFAIFTAYLPSLTVPA